MYEHLRKQISGDGRNARSWADAVYCSAKKKQLTPEELRETIDFLQQVPGFETQITKLQKAHEKPIPSLGNPSIGHLVASMALSCGVAGAYVLGVNLRQTEPPRDLDLIRKRFRQINYLSSN